MTVLFHTREEQLNAGDLIEPGRWGGNILKAGQLHPFFYREHLLETWRVMRKSAVSRFKCAFAFETLEQSIRWAVPNKDTVYSVEIADPNAQSARLDMNWITAMGNTGSNPEWIERCCTNYWTGLTCNETPTWEWLIECPLRVLSVAKEREIKKPRKLIQGKEPVLDHLGKLAKHLTGGKEGVYALTASDNGQVARLIVSGFLLESCKQISHDPDDPPFEMNVVNSVVVKLTAK